MNDDGFASKIGNLHAGINELQQRIEQLRSDLSHKDALQEALEELRSSLEELHVAEEEMRRQNEELALAHHAQERERQRYLELFDSAPDGYLVTDSEGTIQEANSAAAMLLGVRQDFLRGKPFLVFIAKEDREAFHTKLNRSRVAEHIRDWEVSIQPRNGASIPVALSVGMRCSEDGKQIGLRWLLRDITDRKKAEEELRKARDELEIRIRERTLDLTIANRSLQDSDERFRVALKNSPIIVFNQDSELRYTWVYDPSVSFFEGSVVGKTDADLFSPHDACRLMDIKLGVLKSGQGTRQEVEITIKDESLFLDITIEPLRNLSDEVVGLTCAAMDITRRKLIEEELRRAKEAAEAGARAKSEFLANMSHEIRTPLNAVIGMTGLLLEENLTTEQRDHVQTIRNSGDSLLALINDILDFSKIDKEKMDLECRPFGLETCLKESFDFLRVAAGEKGLRLAYVIDDQTPSTVVGDATRLRQILVNLLSNAVKFTENGEVKVSVGARQITGDRYEFKFSVRDTGIGIPEDYADRLFQRFSQSDMSNTRKYGGTGLGLAISKQLVELMGGRIWAESEPGMGSTFSFTFPTCAKFDSPIGAKEPIFQTKTDARTGTSRALRILVAEDNPVNQKMAMLMLKRLGYRGEAVADGREVLKALERQPYDVVLMDIQMPEMDGLEAAKRIRERRSSAQPKIIAVTAYAMTGDRERCIEAGMQDYLAKPFTQEELKAVLERVDSQ